MKKYHFQATSKMKNRKLKSVVVSNDFKFERFANVSFGMTVNRLDERYHSH